VKGFAPTSRTEQKLGEAGLETSTLQKHLVRGQQLDPRLADILVQDVLAKRGTGVGSTAPVNILSDRELQVLGLVAQGYTSAEIAKQIFVGVKTVETYRSRSAEKLGLRTRSEVIRFAVQMGLLTPEALEREPSRSAR